MAISKDDLKFLARVPLLAAFDEAERERFGAYLRESFYQGGQVILWEGRSHQALHILVEGSAVVTKAVRGDVETVLTHLKPASHFGELDLIDAQSASATVTAEESCRLLSITREGLDQLFARDTHVFGKFAWAMMRDLAGKLRTTNARLREAITWGLDAASIDITA